MTEQGSAPNESLTKTTVHRRLCAVAVPLLVLVDQGTKWLAQRFLEGRGVRSAIPGVLDVRYGENPGAFLGWGAHFAPTMRRPLFIALSVAAAALLTMLYIRAQSDQRVVSLGLALLLAGALGNLVDRVVSGDVVDFLHLHVGELWDWATFNLADAYIFFGIVLLGWDFLFGGRGPVSAVAEDE